MGNKKDIKAKTSFKYNRENQDYAVQLKKKRYWWWLLLFLLILPLLIKCNKDVTIQVVDESGTPCAETDVKFIYSAHFLYDNNVLFANELYSATQQTDTNGVTVFKNLRYSVYSCIFYFLSRAEISAVSECTQSDENAKPYFHFIVGQKPLRLKMKTTYVDVPLKIVDDELNSPINEAIVLYEYEYNGSVHKDSVKSNANGDVIIPHIPKCYYLNLICTEKEGYKTDYQKIVKVLDLLAAEQYRTIRLKPVKERFEFYVKNKFTKQPIPAATAIIKLNDIRRGISLETISVTNVDGMGMGFYDNAFVLASVNIKASKRHFKDGELSTINTVKQFKALSSEEQTVYLEPDPFTVEFQNVDSITARPIPGIKNEISVYGSDGNVHRYSEVSNRNGFFNVKANEGEKVEIVSTLLPQYKIKNTTIISFDKGDVVVMEPNVVSLTFRTVEGNSSNVLPDCHLEAYIEGEKINDISNSGTGEFMIPSLYYYQQLSIVASKARYRSNSTKIQNASVAYLAIASQSTRDIPLFEDKCVGTWIIKFEPEMQSGERLEYECVLNEDNTVTVYCPSRNIFDETYQCSGDKLTINWKVRHDSGCSIQLTGTVSDRTIKGEYIHIDINEGRRLYDKGTFSGYLKD
jgi:hypothetical protein